MHDYRADRVKVTDDIKNGVKNLILVEQDVQKKKKHSAKWYRNKMIEVLSLTEENNPSLRSYEALIQSIRKDFIGKSNIDELWSIGCCVNYHIPAEIIPMLIAQKQRLIEDKQENNALYEMAKIVQDPTLPIFSIRKAQWFAKLHPSLILLIEEKYQKWNIDEQLSCIAMIVEQYAHRARLADLSGNTEPDTSDLDDRYFINEDLSLAAIGIGYVRTFMSIAQDKEEMIDNSIRKYEQEMTKRGK